MNTSFNNIILSKPINKVITLNNNLFIQCIRILSFIVSIFNLIVLTRTRHKEPLNKYLLVMSIVDAFYTILMAVMSVLNSIFTSQDPDSKNPYFDLVYLISYVVFSEYLTSSLAVFNIIMEIFLTLQRISHILNKCLFFKNAQFKIVVSVILIISLLIYSPVLFIRHIKTIQLSEKNENTSVFTKFSFRLEKSSFGKSTIAVFMINSVSITRIILVMVVLLVLNIILVFKLKDYLLKKPTLKQLKSKLTRKIYPMTGKKY
jgi:hypothetical protein